MGHTLRLAHHGHHHVGLFRRRHRFIDHRLRRARIDLHRFLIQVEEIDNTFIVGDVSAAGIDNLAFVAQRLFDAGQHRHRLIRHPCRRPAAR